MLRYHSNNPPSKAGFLNQRNENRTSNIKGNENSEKYFAYQNSGFEYKTNHYKYRFLIVERPGRSIVAWQ